ncbi:unnamed protein product [Candidatus Paraburkholderia kirkii UZHbot1]|uniref:WGS project CAFE00000000 data, contig bkir_c159 n=1 Tax=Candidatus Paraburkholderia kirkii UZHbot1 TaxID=1055526 RepID=U3UAJ5_9BURK|nr:unnamed protein product [Candidatus Paraburkholderia kirkii UZHbot1]
MPQKIRAIVTGHTRGLGAALAEILLGQGVDVLAISRKRNAALAARHPDALHGVELDLADLAALAAWLAGDALHRFVNSAERVLLINNAGVLAPVSTLADQGAAGVARGQRQCGRSAADAVRRRRAGPRTSGGYARSCVERRRAQCLSRMGRLLRDQGRTRSARTRGRARRQSRAAHLQCRAERRRH